MKATFKFTLNTGDIKQATAGLSEFVRVERHFGKPVSEIGASVEAIYFMAYLAAKRAGFAGDDFLAWLDDVDDITQASEVTPDPLDQ